MNNIADQIGKIINTIAEKLGIAVQMVYPVLRKQAMVDGIYGLLILFTLAIISIILIKLCTKEVKAYKQYHLLYMSTNESKQEKEYKSLKETKEALAWTYGICGVITTAIAGGGILATLKTYITALLNPDWYIINNMLKQLVTVVQ